MAKPPARKHDAGGFAVLWGSGATYKL